MTAIKTVCFALLALFLAGAILLALTVAAAHAETVPSYAVPVASSAGNPLAPGLQASIIANTQAQIVKINQFQTQVLAGACLNWTATATNARNAGQPIPAPPSQPAQQVLNVSSPDSDGTIWMWVSSDGVVGAPCPPLPPVAPPAAPNTPDIGQVLVSPWYQCLADDTMANNAVVNISPAGTWSTAAGTQGISFVSGTKPPAGQYAKTPGVIGCWYLKIQ